MRALRIVLVATALLMFGCQSLIVALQPVFGGSIPPEIKERPAFTSFDPTGTWLRSSPDGTLAAVFVTPPEAPRGAFLQVKSSADVHSPFANATQGLALADADSLEVVLGFETFVEYTPKPSGARALVGKTYFSTEAIPTPVTPEWTGEYDQLEGVNGASFETYRVRHLSIRQAARAPGAVELQWSFANGDVLEAVGLVTPDHRLVAARYNAVRTYAGGENLGYATTWTSQTVYSQRPRVAVSSLKLVGDHLEGRTLVATPEADLVLADRWTPAFGPQAPPPLAEPARTDFDTKTRRKVGDAVRARPPYDAHWRLARVVEAPEGNIRLHFEGTDERWTEWTAATDVAAP